MSLPKGERGRQILQWRKAMRHTQLSLAIAIGTNPETVSSWERGISEPLPVFFSLVKKLYEESCGAVS